VREWKALAWAGVIKEQRRLGVVVAGLHGVLVDTEDESEGAFQNLVRVDVEPRGHLCCWR
jgi:hypothetical protein